MHTDKFTIKQSVLTNSAGEKMYALAAEMFPICRSITGNGVRQSLDIIKKYIPIDINEVPTGRKVFDWEVPKEWNIKNAYIKNSQGEEVISFKNSNLHVLNYSVPIHKHIALDELRPHLFFLQDQPDWIPYRTSYYKEDWGFCISYNQFKTLAEDVYEVFIDSTLEPGHLTYGEYYLPGAVEDEVLISAHICHPSLANDNLSGISVSVFLAKELQKMPRRYSYRFLFIPGTIGAITWLAVNEKNAAKIKHGLVLSLLGDAGNFTYKKSRRDTAEIDQVVSAVLTAADPKNRIIDFIPYGYDERQYCSPGFNLAVGCLSRSTYGQYIQYHTSADNLDFIRPEFLEGSLNMTVKIIEMLEANQKFLNLNPMCEPQLGKRGLYNLRGGNNDSKEFQMAMLWVLNLSDGAHSLLDIHVRSKMNFDIIKEAANSLLEVKLIREIS
jgi:aminopeptidase-like protein